MRKVAMPIGEGCLCDHFEEFQYFLVFDCKNPSNIREDIKYPPSREIENLLGWLLNNGITDIITRGIEHEVIKKLNHHKIHVFVGVRRENPEDLIKDYLNNDLETNEGMCY